MTRYTRGRSGAPRVGYPGLVYPAYTCPTTPPCVHTTVLHMVSVVLHMVQASPAQGRLPCPETATLPREIPPRKSRKWSKSDPKVTLLLVRSDTTFAQIPLKSSSDSVQKVEFLEGG